MSSTEDKSGTSPLWYIAIIAVLLFIFWPRIGGLTPGPWMASGANLRSIAGSYQTYVHLAGYAPRIFTTKPGDTAHDVAILLARENGLNDAALWFIKQDKKLTGQSLPKSVLVGDIRDGTINPDFAKLPLSYEFAANVPADAPPNSTPIAWTRGLRENGTWAPDSPWGGNGGHIAYLDGHVEWVDIKLSTEQGGTCLINFMTHKPTVNIREALPPGAVILSAEPHPFIKATP